MSAKWETVETMLDSSQRIRNELLEATRKLDSYIEVLKAELASREPGSGAKDMP